MKSTLFEDNKKIMNGFKRSEKEAEKIISDKSATSKKLNEAFDKLKSINDGPIKSIVEDVMLMIDIIGAYIQGIYKQIPLNTVIALLAALVYFVSPIDAIPDFLPGIGYIDDALIIAMTLKFAHADLQIYKNWKMEQAQ